jgi:periplasmic divalent cation tolerance protein
VRIVTTAAPDRAAAEALARSLVEDRLAACVQLRDVGSVYRWEGDVVEDDEVALDVTTPLGFDAVADAIRARHPYDVPEILAVDADAVDADYADWADDVTR